MKLGVYDIINNPLPKLNKLKEFECKQEIFEYDDDIVSLMNKNLYVDKLSSEHIYAFGFTYAMKPKGIIHVALGTCDGCQPNMRDLAIGLLLIGAEQFICFHNHPGGAKEISESDILISKEYEKVGNLIGIKFSKHIMITQGFYDYCENINNNIPFS